MNTQHTPGPWLIRTSGSVGTSGMMVASIYPMEHDSPAENHANALLIAAAPELLGAVMEALDFVEGQEDVSDGPDGKPQANAAMLVAQILRAAIAKATGEQA